MKLYPQSNTVFEGNLCTIILLYIFSSFNQLLVSNLNWPYKNLARTFQIGSEFEDEIFEGLQTATKSAKFQNTVVLSGLTLEDCNLKTLGEFDFIVISAASKSIIHIEAKRGNNPGNREHAEIQLNRGQAFFEENFPFRSSENWKYIKMMCFGEFVDKDICENCKPYLLGLEFIKKNTIQSVSKEIAHQFSSFINTFSDSNAAGLTGIEIML